MAFTPAGSSFRTSRAMAPPSMRTPSVSLSLAIVSTCLPSSAPGTWPSVEMTSAGRTRARDATVFIEVLPQGEGEHTGSACNGDVLVAVDRIRHRARSPVLAGAEVPEALPVRGIGCDKPFVCAVEQPPAGRCNQTAAENAAADPDLPGCFSTLDVERLENPSRAAAGRPPRDTAVERLARFPPLILLRVDRARLFREHV